MTLIHNTDLFAELREGTKAQTARDSLPTQLAEKVVPVMEVNPKLLRKINIIANAAVAATGAGTLYTTPANQDFYLVGVNFHMIKDAACDVATGAVSTLTITQDGATKVLLGISGITLTAQDENRLIMFPIPIKLDRNSLVRWTATYAAGVMARNGTLYGYIDEKSNA